MIAIVLLSSNGAQFAQAAVLHKMLQGQDWLVLANKYGVSAQDIKNVNNLSTTKLTKGQVLVIHGANDRLLKVARTLKPGPLRQGPGPNWASVTSVSTGSPAVALDYKNGWVKLQFYGKQGWLERQVVEVKTVIVSSAGVPRVSQALVQSNYTPLKAGPGNGYKNLATLTVNSPIKMLIQDGNWFWSSTTNGLTGWVEGSKLNPVIEVTSRGSSSRPNQGTNETPAKPDPITTGQNPEASPGENQPPSQNSTQPSTTGNQSQPPVSNNSSVDINGPGTPDAATPPAITPPAASGAGAIPSSPSTVQNPVVNPVPQTPEVRKMVLGYYVKDWEQDNSSFNSVRNYGDSLTSLALFSFAVDEKGNLNGKNDLEAITLARQKNLKIYALIHNIYFGQWPKSPNVAKAVLANPEVRTTTVNNIVSLVKRNGYDGVNIDIENINPADRDNYTSFVRELSSRLKPDGYTISLSVGAKERDDPKNTWSWPWDYQALEPLVDYLAIMAYDEHNYGSGPGPVASVGMVERVIKYALSVLPKEKILLGLAAYGFDWTQDRVLAPEYLSFSKILERAKLFNTPILWDEVSRTPYYRYNVNGLNHEVWFENAWSTAAKVELVQKYDLAGVAIWRLGFEDPAGWTYLKKLTEKK